MHFLALVALFGPVLARPGSFTTRKGPAALPHTLDRRQGTQDAGISGSCQTGTETSIKAPKANIFQGLTDLEYVDVTAFLHQQQDLNLTAILNSTSWDNVIISLDVLQPNKSDALAYLQGTGPQPPRFAKATLQFGATEEPYIQEYTVGPLPVTNSSATAATKVEELNWQFTTGSGRTQVFNADAELVAAFNLEVGADVKDITQFLLNGTATGEETDTLLIAGNDPLIHSGGKVFQWNEFYSAHTGEFFSETILPTSLQFKIDITGRDPSQWQVVGWYYNGDFWKTTGEFKRAANGSSIRKPGPVVDGPWSGTDQAGEQLPRDEYYPPISVQPDGRRFGVDVEQNYVEWMDFSFYISTHKDVGMQLHDIRFKGERLIYEVGLNEALAHYASQDPLHANSAYLDTSYGIGTSTWNLVDGFDCPSHSTYLNTSFYISETTHVHPNSLCLFEHDTGFPIQRHLTGTYVSATKHIVFTVRSVSTVGNYDYLFEYNFHTDGSIEVAARASGYIQGAFWSSSESGDYGFHIYDNLSGSMHDHVINYKLDLDMKGTDNSVLKTDFVPATVVYPWSDGEAINTMKFERALLETEDEGKIQWTSNGATIYAVVNTDCPNKYGEYPGYRIMPHIGGTPYLTVQRSTALGNTANWASHNLFALQRHDSEPRSAYPYNSYDPAQPAVNFDDFFNSESLKQEDIVLYFNLGMHHAPNTADLPNTVTTTAASSILLAPQNYFAGDQSRSTIHQVRMNFDTNSTVVSTDLFGAKFPSCSADLQGLEPELGVFVGEIKIPKFPFNPSGSLQTNPGG